MLYEEILKKGFCTAESTECMSEDVWLDKRREGIGGSDSGAILNMNRFATPLSVYIAKKNLLDSDLNKNNQSIKWGKMAEAAIRKGLADDLNLQIETAPVMFKSVKNPFMLADLDGVIFVPEAREINGKTVKGIGGLEIKTATSRNTEFGSDEIPDSYYCQVQHYMAVTGLDWFVLCVLIDKANGRIYTVPRNDDFINNTLIPAEKSFWNDYVLAEVMPAPTGNEYESKIVDGVYKECAAEVELPEDVSLLCDEYNLAAQEEKAAGEKKEIIKEKIKIAIMKASPTADVEKQKIIAKAGGAKISWNKQVRKVADTDKLKKSGLFDEYCKESASLVMRITAEKKAAGAADVF